jgi:cellulose synthase/poly-beta-1,6-N-acetylglucosamine synthase-like glycosyltransferase
VDERLAAPPRYRRVLALAVLFAAAVLAMWLSGMVVTALSGVVGSRSLGVPAVDAEVEVLFTGVGAFYLFGTLFPFLSFVGWRPLARPRSEDVEFLPFVSVVIPAFNEEDRIAESIAAAIGQDYPHCEILIVNDGSSDLTKYIAERHRVRFIDLRQNRGKARAVNVGIKHARGDILVFSDSDSLLQADAVRNLVRHFVDPEVGAVAGRVSIDNTSKFITRLQQVEYLFGQEVVKRAQVGSASSVLVCPGPVCAFRRQALDAIGGFSDRTLTEDFDATLAVIRAGYWVAYESRAVALTTAPITWRQLKKQRLRWSRGMFQVFADNTKLIWDRRAGLIGGFWMPYYVISGIGSLVMEAALIIILPYIVLCTADPLPMLGRGAVFLVVIETLVSLEYLLGLAAARQLRPRLLVAAVATKPYNMFLSYIRLAAVIAELGAKKNRW